MSALLKLPFGPPYFCNASYRTDEILDRESLQNDMDRKDRSQIRRILTGWKITWDLLQTSTWRYRWNPVTCGTQLKKTRCFFGDVAGQQRSRRPWATAKIARIANGTWERSHPVCIILLHPPKKTLLQVEFYSIKIFHHLSSTFPGNGFALSSRAASKRLLGDYAGSIAVSCLEGFFEKTAAEGWKMIGWTEFLGVPKVTL